VSKISLKHPEVEQLINKLVYDHQLVKIVSEGADGGDVTLYAIDMLGMDKFTVENTLWIETALDPNFEWKKLEVGLLKNRTYTYAPHEEPMRKTDDDEDPRSNGAHGRSRS
jgi:hypothetical protein